jgi:site-specific DNA-methyltransferase (adenine-specific)
MPTAQKRSPGLVRDAILSVLSDSDAPLSVAEITRNVEIVLGPTPSSSIRSYLRLNTPELFEKSRRGVYRAKTDPVEVFREPVPEPPQPADWELPFTYGNSELFHSECFEWLRGRQRNSIHAVVTDPPFGLQEYSSKEVEKLRNGKGGVWRIPPSFDGNTRSPLPRFTVLTEKQLDDLAVFFYDFGIHLVPVLVPGANVVVAANPLLSYLVSNALANAGLERRGEIVRLTMTMRGGDRPKNAHKEFRDVSVMPRSMWEPWLVFRKPLEGRVQDNLKKWKTGGFRRVSDSKPFGDVISSSPTRKQERNIAPHPSLKPQAFLRQIVRASLPLGSGIVLDPFAGSGSTLAAAEAVGYNSVGLEKDKKYFEIAKSAIPTLSELECASRCDISNSV